MTGPRNDIEHELRPSRERSVVSARAIVVDEDVASFVRDSLRAIRSQLLERHELPTGPPFAHRRRVDQHRFIVEAGWPVDRWAHAPGAVHVGMLPATVAAACRPAGTHR